MLNWFKSLKTFETQKEAVLSHLQKGKSITQLEATQRYGILRLSAVVYTLRDKGYDIKTIRKPCKKRGTYAEYCMII